MKLIFYSFLFFSLLVHGCVSNQQTSNVIHKSPEQVLEEYISLFSYTGISERLNKLKAEKELAMGYTLDSLNADISYLQDIKNINSEWYSLCKEVEILSGKNPCAGNLDRFEKINRNFEILSKEIIEETSDTAKIKIKYRNTFNTTLAVNVSEGEMTYILEKVDDYWKISDFINEKGELLSGTDELTTKKQEDSKLIQEDKQTINEIKSQVQALKLSQEQAKSEPKQTLYNMNQDILVDYLSYKVTKVETFKEMGTSIYNKKTEGKFVKIYLKITNNAKETKQIFTPRFKIEDGYGRRYDRLSDDYFYISDALDFGKQLQPGLPVSGAIVFEMPEDSEDLTLIVSGDWLSTSEIKIKLNNMQKIGKDTTQQQEQNKRWDAAMEEAEQQTQELLSQCNSPFTCTSSCHDYIDVGQKNCPSGQLCCMQ